MKNEFGSYYTEVSVKHARSQGRNPAWTNFPCTYLPYVITRIRAVLIEQLFPRFSSFFPRKTGTIGSIAKVWKFNRGETVWNASHSSIFVEKNWQIWKYKKLRGKKGGNLDKSPWIKTAVNIQVSCTAVPGKYFLLLVS